MKYRLEAAASLAVLESKLDTNSDGQLTQDELAKGPWGHHHGHGPRGERGQKDAADTQ